ncbi:MAG: glycosyltransferase, partial [Thermoleophilaceae bacterium]|nr:glycosyltransferase [Thermoleophilaceae bacterium]
MSPEPLAVPGVIVHDWFAGYHGSDRVVETLRSRLFAPEFTPDVMTFHAEHDLLPPALTAAIVAESRLAALPGLRQRGHDNGRWRYLLPYMPRWFARLDLDRYDLVLSSSHACAAGVHKRPGAVHVCYCHAPMRYAWSPEIDDRRAGPVAERALRLLARRMRAADRRASRLPDVYVANSTAVQERIRRFYGRESTVVHPPVDTAAITLGSEQRSGFLWVHRLVPYKQPLLVAEAFRGLDARLTMVGVGPLEAELQASLPDNVELRGWVERDELIGLY